MKIWRDLTQLPAFNSTVLTIGTFDGVHLGHQKILQRLDELAQTRNAQSVLITFHPHPRSIVAHSPPVPLLTTPEEKALLLSKFGLRHLVITPFTRGFSELSPEAYITSFLVQKFSPSAVVIGYNHRFGRDRKGDIQLLRRFGKGFGFDVEEIGKETLLEWEISSTHIRKAISSGDIQMANRLLGYAYFFEGIVVKGQQLGRKLGFPTANIHIENKEKLLPAEGIYAVNFHSCGQCYGGMMSIGGRPTINEYDKTIEVNIFDFSGDIYGEKVTVEMRAFIRKIEKFPDLDKLILQLKEDEKIARQLLSLL